MIKCFLQITNLDQPIYWLKIEAIISCVWISFTLLVIIISRYNKYILHKNPKCSRLVYFIVAHNINKCLDMPLNWPRYFYPVNSIVCVIIHFEWKLKHALSSPTPPSTPLPVTRLCNTTMWRVLVLLAVECWR